MRELDSFVQALESRRLLSNTPPTAAPLPVTVSAVHEAAAALPQVFSINPTALAAAKAQVASGSAKLQPAYKALIASANSDLNMAPVAVTDKTNPSGISAHDYVSYARYYWPNPKTKSGLPYVDRDGDVNQAQVNKGDVGNLDKLLSAVSDLAMAYYFTGKASYATKAADLLEVWFINPATRMNPNLNHAQIQLGNGTGSFYGIIDARNFYGLVDALGLLNPSAAWTKADRTAMTTWLTQYNTWLQTSTFGKWNPRR